MSRLTDRLERDLREVGAGAHPSPSAWESIAARFDEEGPELGHVLALAPAASAPARWKRRVWPSVAAAALLVIVGSIAVITWADDDPSISTAATDLTATFVSPRNGFSVKHPEGAAVTAARQVWGWSARVDDGFDVVEIDPATVFKGTSRAFSGLPCSDAQYEEMPCGSVDDRIDLELSEGLPGGCGIPRGQQVEVTVDGQPGRIAECSGRVEATVVAGGRLYVFTLAHDRSDARAIFETVADTIDLTPRTGVDFAGLTETFVSPTYGLSFGYIRGITPATERWSPGNQPVEDIDFDPRFDAAETGYGAYLEAASTEIPDGVSIDEWIDQYVSPVAAGGCGVPRSEQAEITVDGQPGRIAECGNRVEATVVAGGRLYLLVLYRDPRDARAMFDAWADTIDLTPETAAGPR